MTPEAELRPRGISAYLVQVTGPERAALLEYAVAHGHGVEVADFTDTALLDDAAASAGLTAWYRTHLPKVRGAISLHGAYRNLAPSATDGKICAATRERVRQCLDLAEDLGARSVVFHSDFDLVPTPGRVSAWTERAAAFWQEAAAGRPLDLLLENAFEPDPQVLRALVEATGRPNVGACFDVSHAYLMSALWARATGRSRGPSPADWLEALGPHVRYLHLSDNDGTWDQHAAPGRGTIDWRAVLGALARRAKPVPAVIEVAGVAGAEETERYLEEAAQP